MSIIFCVSDEDEPLFMSLIDDLFPNMVQEKGYHNQLTTAIGEVVNELGLINHPPWTLKLIQASLINIPNY